MKRRLLAVAILVSVVALLLAAPAAADTTRTKFTGTITAMYFEPNMGWVPGPNWWFFRGAEYANIAQTDYAALNGWLCGVYNGNYILDRNSDFGAKGTFWGKSWWVPSTESGEPDCSAPPLWEGSYTGHLLPDGTTYYKGEYFGRGPNEGLQFRMEQWATEESPVSSFSGEILNPGAK